MPAETDPPAGDAGTVWVVARTDNPRFPYRISLEQAGRVTLALRTQEKWPGPGGQIFCLRERPEDGPTATFETVERVPVAALTRRGRKLSVALDRPRNKRCEFLFLTRAYKHQPGEYEQIFFRTASAVRAHKTRGRPQTFGEPAIEVVVDSRERHPWHFPGATVRRQPLAAGGYALLDREHLVAVVERKTLQTLLADVGRIQILHQLLGELSTYPHAAVVIEAQYGDFLDPEKIGRWSAAHVARVLTEVAALHPAVPLVYAGNRKLAAQWAHGFFAAVAARLEERAADAAVQVAVPRAEPPE